VSSTRLLILGAVRILQPVHGYLVRRELTSWQVDRWAYLNPGSVYNALRTLARERFLEQVDAEPQRQGRTTYRLTANGEVEFLTLLREALWTFDAFAPDRFMAGICFMGALPREEVIGALESRLGQMEQGARGFEETVEEMLAAPRTPDHVTEVLRLGVANVRGEAAWTRELVARLRAGSYRFGTPP
jgi:DNA-binding PadR family transcriptional regulator